MTRSRRVPGHPVRMAVTVLVGLAVGLLVLSEPGIVLGSEGAEGGGLIEINRSLVIQVINFLILLALLYRFLFKPLVATLDGRSAAIRQQLAEAREAREAAQRQLAEFEARLQAAQADAQAVRERAQREAAETRERLTAEARQEAARLLGAAQDQIAQEVRRARAELRAELGDLAIQIAERLIRTSLRDEDHQRLVRDALTRLDSV